MLVGQWYNFNDSSVSKIDVATVKRAWGGSWASTSSGAGGAGANALRRPLYKGTSYSGANAYMLMYRRIEPGRNAVFPSDVEVPGHVREGVSKDEERANKEKAEWENRLNALTVRCVSTQYPDGRNVISSKKDTLRQLREQVRRPLPGETRATQQRPAPALLTVLLPSLHPQVHS